MIGWRILHATAAVVLLASPAAAADLLPSAPLPVAAPPETIGGGWYLRGDFTESFFERPVDATLADPADPGLPPLVGLRLSRESGYGGGIGYHVNEWLRLDATVDQRGPARFSAYSSRSNFVTGSNIEAGRLDVLTALVNVYADLGTWWGLTPYLGVGIGVADKRMHGNYSQTTCIEEGCDGLAGTGPRDPAFRPNRSVASLAWALTAGASYRLGAGFSLDAAYRYVDLGRAKSGIDAFGGSSRFKELAANEVRVGLRYDFGGTPLGQLLPAPHADPYGN